MVFTAAMSQHLAASNSAVFDGDLNLSATISQQPSQKLGTMALKQSLVTSPL
jgi:hypothetical protein